MRDDIDFSRYNSRTGLAAALGSSAVRLALLFSTAGIMLALFLAPQADRLSRPIFAGASFPADLDLSATGSTRLTNSYTVRRSVLQPSPDSICVIRENGARYGDC